MKRETRNLTLAIEEDLLVQARRFALDRHSSVNQLVRDYLDQVVHLSPRRQAARAHMREMMRTKRIHLGKGKWTREDRHER